MQQSKRTVIVAFFVNAAIAVFKLVAGLISKSSSMLAESYHSFSDTFNQVCLFLGLNLSKKQADEKHPFGYGNEQFFWSFIVAVMLFGVAGVLSVKQGIQKLINPHVLEDVTLSYIALGVAFVLEAYGLSVALKEIRHFMKTEKCNNIFQAIRDSKNSIAITVVFEDSLALTGLIIAAIGIFLSETTGNIIFDSIASIVIGVLLMLFAFMLAYKVKNLLIGESVSPMKRKNILKIVNSFKEVENVVDLRTMHLSAEEALIVIEVNFKNNVHVGRLEKVIAAMDTKIKQAVPGSKVIIEAHK